MDKPLYITSDGILSRRSNTLYFINKDGKRPIPIEIISEIYCYGRVSLKSGATSLLLKKKIATHFFNKYGYYEGTLYPRDCNISGTVLLKQAEHHLHKKKRQYIAKEFVEAIKHNILQTLRYYEKKGKNISDIINSIENIQPDGEPDQLMGHEGYIWSLYYKAFPLILKGFEFERREIRPPTTELNAMISFGNSLLYSTVLSEIYNTHLNPAISYLHEPMERRFSLSLDIADIFKPVIVERIVFKLINTGTIKKDHFERDIGILLNPKGREIFLNEYQNKLETTVLHPVLKRRVSYRYLIRLEAYKIIKHLLGDKKYKGFRMWW